MYEKKNETTPDEQIILSKYVGWGGIPEAFDEGAGSWQTELNMLKNILTPEEYASARESTLTAFYTPPMVIKAVYKAMEQMGFREGNILEPSCGIGHFVGTPVINTMDSSIETYSKNFLMPYLWVNTSVCTEAGSGAVYWHITGSSEPSQ